MVEVSLKVRVIEFHQKVLEFHQKVVEFHQKVVEFNQKVKVIEVQSVTSRSREFPFPGILNFFMVSEPESKIFGTEKSLGIGIEKNWY